MFCSEIYLSTTHNYYHKDDRMLLYRNWKHALLTKLELLLREYVWISYFCCDLCRVIQTRMWDTVFTIHHVLSVYECIMTNLYVRADTYLYFHFECWRCRQRNMFYNVYSNESVRKLVMKEFSSVVPWYSS